MPSVLGERATVRVIHVLRKPLSEGTVASNTLKHGCGGLNIDGSRVGRENRTYKGSGVSEMRYTDGRAGLTDGRGRDMEFSVSGRWPANVILQHLDGCRCEGIKRVKGTGPRAGGSGSRFNDPGNLLSRKGHEGVRTNHAGLADKDGKETVANWICVEGCPVAALDEQSGVRAKGNFPSQQNTASWKMSSKGKSLTPEIDYGDSGGASRFFKQIGGEK